MSALGVKAARLIERDGWCKGRAFGPNGTRCAFGALTAANKGIIPDHILDAFLKRNGIGLIAWNDQQTDKSAVVAMLKTL